MNHKTNILQYQSKILPQSELKFLQQDQHTFELNFGKVSIKITKDGYIQIKNSHANIELRPDGKININGQEINQQGIDIHLNSYRHIHLNTPQN